MDVTNNGPLGVNGIKRRRSVDQVKSMLRREEYSNLLRKVESGNFDQVARFLNGSDLLNTVLSHLNRQEYAVDSYASDIIKVLNTACEKLDAFLTEFEQRMDVCNQLCQAEPINAKCYQSIVFPDSVIINLRYLKNHAEKILSKRVQVSCKNIIKRACEQKMLPEENRSLNNTMAIIDEFEKELMGFGERASDLLVRSGNDFSSQVQRQLECWMQQLGIKPQS
ncbi:MAG: hypothetical protein ACON35_06145 [Candidatus Marinamargulisbacteria bacterium]